MRDFSHLVNLVVPMFSITLDLFIKIHVIKLFQTITLKYCDPIIFFTDKNTSRPVSAKISPERYVTLMPLLIAN